MESYPLEKGAEAYQRMLSGAARFRVALVTKAGAAAAAASASASAAAGAIADSKTGK